MSLHLIISLEWADAPRYPKVALPGFSKLRCSQSRPGLTPSFSTISFGIVTTRLPQTFRTFAKAKNYTASNILCHTQYTRFRTVPDQHIKGCLVLRPLEGVAGEHNDPIVECGPFRVNLNS